MFKCLGIQAVSLIELLHRFKSLGIQAVSLIELLHRFKSLGIQAVSLIELLHMFKSLGIQIVSFEWFPSFRKTEMPSYSMVNWSIKISVWTCPTSLTTHKTSLHLNFSQFAVHFSWPTPTRTPAQEQTTIPPLHSQPVLWQLADVDWQNLI
jgi:hypothetical protein